MLVKTSELTGAQLDWAVAKCEGFTDYDPVTEKIMPPRKEYGWVAMYELNYSTDWSQGGPIIDREIDAIYKTRLSTSRVTYEAMATGDAECVGWGPTPLIAAMRCYVAIKLGDVVDVPDELK